MSKAETASLRALANVLATAPGLGAFAVAVGQLGLDGAVQLCATREVPTRLARIWSVLGYRLEQLPSAEEIRLLLIGVEVRRRTVIDRKLNTTRAYREKPLSEMIDGLCSMEDAMKGLRLLRSYGGRVEVRPELGAV